MDGNQPEIRAIFIAPLLLAFAFLVIGPYMVYLGISPYLEDSEMGDWASTPGSIVASEVQSEYVQGRGGKIWHYYPAYQYTYEVNGVIFEDASRAPTGDFSTEEGAQEYLDEHPIGSQVEVYYDPEEPSDSVLDRSDFDMMEQLPFFVAGSIMLLFGAVVSITILRRLWRTKQT